MRASVLISPNSFLPKISAAAVPASPSSAEARSPLYAATPARRRSPAPISWLAYAVAPIAKMSLSASTHHIRNIEVVTAAVASTPSPRTHSASTHWYPSRSRFEANTGSANLSSARGIGWVIRSCCEVDTEASGSDGARGLPARENRGGYMRAWELAKRLTDSVHHDGINRSASSSGYGHEEGGFGALLGRALRTCASDPSMYMATTATSAQRAPPAQWP